jgi:hypothetical protein
MDPRILGVMANQHGLVTFRQVREFGLLDQDVALLVRRRTWRRVRRGVFIDGDEWAGLDLYRGQPLLRVRAAHLVVQKDHWFSHESAGLIHGIPLADPRTAGVHLTRPRVLGDRAKAGIIHHKGRVLAPSSDDRGRTPGARRGSHRMRSRSGERSDRWDSGLRPCPASWSDRGRAQSRA